MTSLKQAVRDYLVHLHSDRPMTDLALLKDRIVTLACNELNTPKIQRVWAMPSKWTFQVKPLRAIIDKYKLPGQIWADPFAGFTSPAEYQNDLNPASPALSHKEAQAFMEDLLGDPGLVDGVIFDPPYSLTQVSRSCKDMGLQFKGAENPTGGFPRVRDLIAAVVKPGGHVISYGWNTVGMGKGRGFEPVEYLICSHGGNRNDTLVTVERRQ